MTFQLEAKAYGPNFLPEEREAIRSRIYVIHDNILMYEEVPVMSESQLKLFLEKILELTQDMEYFYFVLNLTETQRPNSIIRKVLKNLFTSLKPKLRHMAVFSEGNFLIRLAAKYVIYSSGVHSYSMHKSYHEALQEAEKVAQADKASFHLTN